AERNCQLEARDGIRRHFEHPWDYVAEINPHYRAYVEAERDRLGEDHPLFETQYRIQSVAQRGRLLTAQQLQNLEGDHIPYDEPLPGRIYVAAIEVAGADEEAEDAALRALKPRKDSTVLTIAELIRPAQTAPPTPPGPPTGAG